MRGVTCGNFLTCDKQLYIKILLLFKTCFDFHILKLAICFGKLLEHWKFYWFNSYEGVRQNAVSPAI